MELTLLFEGNTYNVEACDFIEDDGEIYDKKCRILCFITSNKEKQKLILVRLNYPPLNYKQEYTQQTSLAIDSAFDKQIELYSILSRNNLLNLDEELGSIPRKIRKYFKITIKDYKDK